jgi:ketosteroid isomerase-like protein
MNVRGKPGTFTMNGSCGVYPGYLGAAFLAVLSACGSQDKTLSAEVTTSIEKTANKGDVEGCAALFTDDSEVLQEDAPVVRGKQAIREFCAEQIHRDLLLDTVSTMSIVSGDLAVEQGTYRVRNMRKRADVEYGEYFNTWKRSGGQWKIFRSMFNQTQAPETDVSVSDTKQEVPAE